MKKYGYAYVFPKETTTRTVNTHVLKMCFFVFPTVCSSQPFCTTQAVPSAPGVSLTSAHMEPVTREASQVAAAEVSVAMAGTDDEEVAAVATPAAAGEAADVGGKPVAATEPGSSVASADEQPLVPADEGQQEADQAALPAQVTCRRCMTVVDRVNCVENPKFRMELRWTCRSCHACHTTLQRHGIEMKSLLNEEETVAFFAEAKAVRDNSADKRLSYSQARGVLKQAMIESSSREDREGDFGEFQPLSFWELRGYNVANIEQLAEKRSHPILGDTYRVDITKKSTEFIARLTEERIVRMESDFRQRQQPVSATAPSSSGGLPALQLDLPAAEVVKAPAGGKKRKTAEEKQQDREASKQAKQEAKKRVKLESTAVATAGKHLPGLQKLTAKLQEATLKAQLHNVPMPPATTELVTLAAKNLASAVANATKMLGGAAKGLGLANMSADVLLNEKETQEVLKKGNEALRALQAVTKQIKGPSAKAKAKTQATKTD